jgi:hypothetical protein
VKKKMTNILNVQPGTYADTTEAPPFTFGRIAVYGPDDLAAKRAEAAAKGHRTEVEPLPKD